VAALSFSEGSNSPGKGSRHWWLQRVTAVTLVPLTLWFLFSIIHHIGDSQAQVVDWITQPHVSVLLVLYLAIMFFHGQLGVQEILEDYIHGERLKYVCGLVVKTILIVSALAGIYSILRAAL